MPNRVRPRCPACTAAMAPVYRKGARGKAFVKIPDVFTCPDHGGVALGRKKAKFAEA